MYKDSNWNEINMIGAYLILYYDINEQKAAKLMIIAKSNIDDISKSGPSNTIFLQLTPTSFGKELNKADSSTTEYYLMSKSWYKDKLEKATFFHLIYRSFESNEHVKCMLFIYVLTLLKYAGRLNRYEIHYFVRFFVHMHVLIQCNAQVKIKIYKRKHNEVF